MSTIYFNAHVRLFSTDAYDSPFQVGPVLQFDSNREYKSFLELFADHDAYLRGVRITHAHISYDERDKGLDTLTHVSFTFRFPDFKEEYYHESTYFTENGKRWHYIKIWDKEEVKEVF